MLNSSAAHLPQFACGGGSALRASAKVVHNGYDDTVSGVTNTNFNSATVVTVPITTTKGTC